VSRVWDLGFRVWGSGFRVQGFGLKVHKQSLREMYYEEEVGGGVHGREQGSRFGFRSKHSTHAPPSHHTVSSRGRRSLSLLDEACACSALPTTDCDDNLFLRRFWLWVDGGGGTLSWRWKLTVTIVCVEKGGGGVRDGSILSVEEAIEPRPPILIPACKDLVRVWRFGLVLEARRVCVSNVGSLNWY
jgi:hypothetical protein